MYINPIKIELLSNNVDKEKVVKNGEGFTLFSSQQIAYYNFTYNDYRDKTFGSEKMDFISHGTTSGKSFMLTFVPHAHPQTPEE
jgi:hypothetical protein